MSMHTAPPCTCDSCGGPAPLHRPYVPPVRTVPPTPLIVTARRRIHKRIRKAHG